MKKLLLSIGALCSFCIAGAQVSTYAGSGFSGRLDGPALTATFDHPNGMAFDKAGNMYVGDWSNNVIRKITPSGIVSTYAGTGMPGYTDGPASSAQFFEPWGIAIDTFDNIYVGDAKNHCIRKISSGGMVSTLAGSGVAGFLNGTGTAARFNYPSAIGIDDSGNVYVGDGNNHAIRKITPAGTVSTVAGTGFSGNADGPVASAQFNVPNCMAVSPTGDIYVCDVWNSSVRKISGGVVSTLAGGAGLGFADGKGAAAKFYNPHGIVLLSDGSLLIADTQNNRIRRIVQDGTVTTVTGSISGYVDGPKSSALFFLPKCLTVDKKGVAYISDEGNNVIRKLVGTGTQISEYQLPPAALFPNPAQNSIHIHCAAAAPQTEISITNLMGQTFLLKTVSTPNNFLTEQLDLSQMTAGTYFIKVSSGNTMQTAGFIKL